MGNPLLCGLPARAPCDSCGRDCPGCPPERTPAWEPVTCPVADCGAENELDGPRVGSHLFDRYPLGSVIRCWGCRARLKCVVQDAYGDSTGDDSTWRWVVVS